MEPETSISPPSIESGDVGRVYLNFKRIESYLPVCEIESILKYTVETAEIEN